MRSKVIATVALLAAGCVQANQQQPVTTVLPQSAPLPVSRPTYVLPAPAETTAVGQPWQMLSVPAGCSIASGDATTTVVWRVPDSGPAYLALLFQPGRVEARQRYSVRIGGPQGPEFWGTADDNQVVRVPLRPEREDFAKVMDGIAAGGRISIRLAQQTAHLLVPAMGGVGGQFADCMLRQVFDGSAAGPPPGTWTTRFTGEACILEAENSIGRASLIVGKGLVVFGMARHDTAAGSLRDSEAVTMRFEGQAAWEVTGEAVGERAIAWRIPGTDYGMSRVDAFLAGGVFRAPRLSFAVSIPPAGQAGRDFLTCVRGLPVVAPAPPQSTPAAPARPPPAPRMDET